MEHEDFPKTNNPFVQNLHRQIYRHQRSVLPLHPAWRAFNRVNGMTWEEGRVSTLSPDCPTKRPEERFFDDWTSGDFRLPTPGPHNLQAVSERGAACPPFAVSVFITITASLARSAPGSPFTIPHPDDVSISPFEGEATECCRPPRSRDGM